MMNQICGIMSRIARQFWKMNQGCEIMDPVSLGVMQAHVQLPASEFSKITSFESIEVLFFCFFMLAVLFSCNAFFCVSCYDMLISYAFEF